MAQVTVGADPELFVTNKDTVVSGIGLIGGSKNHPRLVTDGAVQEDNVLAEFNIDPCVSSKDFVAKVRTVTEQLNHILAPLNTVCKASHLFERQTLMDAGPQALEFGCDPDLNCWTREENMPPNPYTELRTAGGHVHVGYDNPTDEASLELACILDYILGVPSVLLDDDERRRSMYGKAGACRIKPYGVEYRVLSNFWLQSETYQTWIFDMAVLATSINLEDLTDLFADEAVVSSINSSNRDMATLICNGLSANVAGFYLPSEEV